MSSMLSLPIAQLRALGCRVSTIIGHDPVIGSFFYSVTLPKGVTMKISAPEHSQAVVLPGVGRRRVIVRSTRYVIGQKTSKQARIAAQVEARDILETIVNRLAKEA